ncbi:MATE family efflux transporter [Shewanella submarina]|uniref:MATE family efflux transporter n=1 Tax=Shewanella submarina TaxID=2016376 RepID=A0ABV7GBW4_9GAMM
MNMTKSVLMFDAQRNRRMLALALPMILSNITVPLLGLVDTAVIGHLSNAYYLGGVAVGSTIITLIFWLLGFLRMATTGLVAQAWGANDTQRQFQLLLQGVSLTLLLSALILILQRPLLELALSMTEASAEVIRYCREYFSIRIWSTPFALLNLVLLGYLLGRQQPKAAMWQLIIANSVNILLDVLFVIGLGWGVKGAAMASVIADFCAMLVALTMVKRQLSLQGGFHLGEQLKRLTPAGYGQLLRLNGDIFVRSLCLQATFAFMTFHGASLGDDTVAANAVLLNLLLLISYALDGIAYYAEAETGRTWGKRDMPELRNTVALAFQWSAVSALGFSLLFFLTGEYIIQLLTGIEAVQHLAFQYLPWLIVMPVLAFGSYLFDGVYIGTAQGKIMRNSMLFCTLMVFFPVWWSLQSWGNGALWAAMSAFMLSRSLSLGLHYRLSLSRG